MKNTLSILVLLLAMHVQAQYPGGMFSKDPLLNQENFDKQRIYYGFYLGFNSYDYKFNYNQPGPEISVKSTTGFNVGLVGDLKLNEFLNFRFEPGLFYTQRVLNYPGFTDEIDAVREVNSTYIQFPFLLKFSAVRTGNIRPYLIGGFSETLNLSSNAQSIDDNLQQKFRVKEWTSNYEVGFGIDVYFEYFKFSPSIRGVFGLQNELIPDNDPNSPWTSNIASMKTRAILVSFCFH